MGRKVGRFLCRIGWHAAEWIGVDSFDHARCRRCGMVGLVDSTGSLFACDHTGGSR